jgi:hypothetical protein
MSPSAQLILEVSLPRSGTTSLMRLMRGFEHVATYGEVFHTSRFWVTGPEAEAVFATEMAPGALHTRLRSDPVWGLERILEHAAATGKSYAEFKLSPHHLHLRQIERIIARFRPIGFVMHRAPVDIYISHKKQTVSGAWEATPTTHIVPELDAKEFLRWRWRQQYHLQMGHRLLERARVPIVTLRYEDLYGPDRPAPETQIKEAFAAQGADFGTFDATVERLQRQDTTDDRAAKVLNWAAFSKAITEAAGPDALERFDLIGSRFAVDGLRMIEKTAPRGLIQRAARLLKTSSVAVKAPEQIDRRGPAKD